MALGIQAYVVALLWSNQLASPSRGPYLREENGTSRIEYSIINTNNEQVMVSWNATKRFPSKSWNIFYNFDEEERKQCPQYLVDQGYKTGCRFKAEGKDLTIEIISDTAGKRQLFFDEENIRMFLKPNPPENVTFHWAEDKVTVQCNLPWQPHCLMLEFQYKSTLDQEWKARKGKCCTIEDSGLDPAKCYSFRLRLERTTDICNKIPYFSEWGAETLWKNGRSTDSCDTEPKTTLLLTIVATVLAVFVLLMCVCRLQRIRRIIMPVIPDPKHLYSDLFSDHNGNFQEWISRTENVLVPGTVEAEEEEFVIEEQALDSQAEKVVPPSKCSLKH